MARQARRKMLSTDEYQKVGVGSDYILDRHTHPAYYVSSWPTTGRGQELLGERAAYRLPHVNPQSVLVTVISNEWCEGGWHRLQDMLRYSEEQGYMVALQEVDDLSLMPGDAIGIMRSCAAVMALDAGVEWCFMVDTDVHLEKDTLVRLLQHDRPIVYPLLHDIENKWPGAGLESPRLKPGMGLQPVTWGAMSCMLFNTKVFNCLDPYAWHGHDYHFAQHLGHFGHRIYIDTDTVVNVVRGPARNLAKDWDTLWSHLRRGYEKRMRNDRDRRPPPDFDPVFGEGAVAKDGVYWAVESDFRTQMNTPWRGKQSRNGKDGDGKETVD